MKRYQSALKWAIATFVAAIPWLLPAQTDRALLRDLAEENKKSVEALALYPEDVRLAVLEAAKYPAVLVNMQHMQQKTSAAFRTLIEDFPRSTQEVFYDLTRYPGLIDDIARDRSDFSAVRAHLQVLPANRRAEAEGVADRQMNTLVKIAELNRTANQAFEDLVAPYPAPAQAAFRKLTSVPEVLDILNEDLRFTVLVGDIYRDDPAWVIRQVDSLSLAVARTHARELEEWKRELESNPQARAELEEATREYAGEYGYGDDLYATDELYAGQDPRHPAVVEHHYYYHYPYWYGYPWWRPYPYWRPWPYWYDWGCYWYDHTVIVVYLPSYHFMHWYFYRPHHFHRYNHLSTVFVNHYNGHRRSGTTISVGVGEWRDNNRRVLSDDFIKNDGRLNERLREYGQFEESRQKYNAKNPGRAVEPEAFLDKNPAKYPEVQRSRQTAQDEVRRETDARAKERTQWAPEKDRPARAEPAPALPPRTDKPAKPKEPQRREPPRTEPEKRPTRPSAQPPAEKPDVDKAQEYHRQKWDETKREKARTQPAPKPQTAPKATPAPEKSRTKSREPAKSNQKGRSG